jgi:hypothetical protein
LSTKSGKINGEGGLQVILCWADYNGEEFYEKELRKDIF